MEEEHFLDNDRVKLILTCFACPEQYDVYIDGETCPSGYLRLRHGYFYAEYDNEKVYEAHPEGDGIFEYDERDKYLNEAVEALLMQKDNA